jgi:hypothetical protein
MIIGRMTTQLILVAGPYKLWMIRAVTIAQQINLFPQSNQWCKWLTQLGTKKEHDGGRGARYNIRQPQKPLWIRGKPACRPTGEV